MLIFWRRHFEGGTFWRCFIYSKAAQYLMPSTRGCAASRRVSIIQARTFSAVRVSDTLFPNDFGEVLLLSSYHAHSNNVIYQLVFLRCVCDVYYIAGIQILMGHSACHIILHHVRNGIWFQMALMFSSLMDHRKVNCQWCSTCCSVLGVFIVYRTGHGHYLKCDINLVMWLNDA